MRDFSHGKVRQEKTRDFGSFKLRVDGVLLRETGMDSFNFGFTDSEIRTLMESGMSAADAADILVMGTDYHSTR